MKQTRRQNVILLIWWEEENATNFRKGLINKFKYIKWLPRDLNNGLETELFYYFAEQFEAFRGKLLMIDYTSSLNW